MPARLHCRPGAKDRPVQGKLTSEDIAELWRERARETRMTASRYRHDPGHRHRLLKMACVYDAMAERVEEERKQTTSRRTQH